ncbi:MAG: hypothetical protein SFW07_07715 [Gammaproteobacteria bacterium]|nr:hypothetical protein [Gammaproteobacteria bacterium]
MDERIFLGKKISCFNRKTKLKLTSIPTYPITLFQRPMPRNKLSTTQLLTRKAFPEDLDTLFIDNDVTLTQEREKYIILIIAEDETDAKEIYGLIARTTGTGSTSPTHHSFQDFQVCLQEEIIIIRGNPDTLHSAVKHLHLLEYISDKKMDALCKKIGEIEDADSDTESSDRFSSEESIDFKFLH